MSVYFNGQLLTTPTTASAIVDDAMRNQGASIGNTAALVGISAGGQPKTPLTFGNPQDAQATLISGELLDAVLAAFDPSDETDGPAQVVAVRVNPATQSMLTLNDASSNPVINLTSLDYGASTNLIRIKVEAGSLSGLRVTTQKGQTYFTQDNIGRNAFSVQYTGSSASATMTINGTQLVLNAPSNTAVATIDLSQVSTVGALVSQIKAVTGFTATLGNGNYNAPTLNGLDFVSAQDVKTAQYTATANLQAVIDWLNSAAQNFVSAARATNAGNPPAVIGWTPLASGTDGSVANQDWADAFTALQTADVQWVTPVSSNANVAAMAESHVQFMSVTGKKERRSIVGTALSTSDAAAISAASLLNSDRTSLVHIGHYNYDSNGVLTLYPPYITAALLAGMASAVSPGTPLTNKEIKVRGLERLLKLPTDTDALINGGVLCVANTESGFKVIQSITTCLWSSAFNRREQSCGAALDAVVRQVRTEIDKLRGKKSDQFLAGRYISVAESKLKACAVPEPNGPGLLAGDANSPAYKNITATLTGDVVALSFQCSPVIPNNYATVTVYAVPYSGTATA
jgi:hypothetical protein